jgi:DNA-binding NarL/FixJ family response regulator
VDVELPGRTESPRRAPLARPARSKVVLRPFADAERLFDAMQAGAVGYLLKHTPPIDSWRRFAVSCRASVLTPNLASRFLREFQARNAGAPPFRLPQLSPLRRGPRLLATGETNRQIASIFVAEETIKSSHRSSARGVRSHTCRHPRRQSRSREP